MSIFFLLARFLQFFFPEIFSPVGKWSRSGWGASQGQYSGSGFVCQYCGKKCISSRDLYGHTNAVHLKIKPFVCEKCGKGFSYNRNLHVHKKTCRVFVVKPQP